MPQQRSPFLLLLLLLCSFLPLLLAGHVTQDYIYDPDVTWAVLSCDPDDLAGYIRPAYRRFMEGCREAAGSPYNAESWCDASERGRVARNRLQPGKMRNYTHAGFETREIPGELFGELTEYWHERRDKLHAERDEYDRSTVNQFNQTHKPAALNTYLNIWESPPRMLDLLPKSLKDKLYEVMRPIIVDWTGVPDQYLKGSAIYGIRVYYDKAFLAPHVDTLPRVLSAILNIDQDVKEEWPLEVYDHDGAPFNVTINPGEMILYESATILHGRPFPMKGNFFANLFVHFDVLPGYDPYDEQEL